MSRVTYSHTPATAEQETLRAVHQVRLVTTAEEGFGVDALPGGVYGFTYSPALPNSPLFAVRRYRSYETHKLANGEIFVVGFTTSDAAREVSSSEADVSLQLQPEPEAVSNTLVAIPYARISQHRRYLGPQPTRFHGDGGGRPLTTACCLLIEARDKCTERAAAELGPGYHGLVRIARPFGPRTRVELHTGQPRLLHGKQIVTRRHAGPAIHRHV